MSGPPSKELLELLREEAQRTVNEQVQTLNDIDTKANKILRLNVLLIGSLLTIVSITLQSPDRFPQLATLINPYTILGTGLLLMSTALAALTYTASTNRVGISANDLLKLTVENDYSEVQVLDTIVIEGYPNWIKFNDKTNIINSLYITLTILALIYAISSFSVGIVVASPYVLAWYEYGTLLIVLGVYTYSTGIKNQIDRYLETRDDE